jgi:PAS domain S-box-containing protein
MSGITPDDVVSPQETSRRLDDLQQVLNAVPTAIIRCNADGRIVYANERAETHLGVPAGGATGQTYDDAEWQLHAVDGSSIPADELPFASVLATGDPITDRRYRIRRGDGSERIVELSGGPIVTDTGDIESAVFAVQDVTDQYDRDRTLERYRAFLVQSPDIMCIVNAEGIVRYQSPMPQAATDFEYPELVGKSGFDQVHPDDRERVRAEFERLLAAGPESLSHAEYRIRQSNGSYRWFEARAINYLGIDPIDGVLLTARDVHRRKETETRLGRYEQTIRTLQETTQRLLRATDRVSAARITLDGIESVFNFSTSGIWLANETQTRLDPIAMSDHGAAVVDSQPAYTADSESLSWDAYESQTAVRIDDMTEHPGRATEDTPIRSELIVPIGEYGVINIGSTERDAFCEDDLRSVRLWSNTVESALARLEQIEQLQEREDALTRERDRLDDFASIISHDLRNLVNVADGHLGVARSRGDLDKLDPVQRAIERMDDIMDDTLTLARQGETVDEREPVDITVLVANCMTVIETPAATVDVVDECSVMADPDRLAHVFENLLRNAVDHGGPDVTVTIGRMADGFYIADSGPGVDPETRDTIFESGYTTREEGTGLGLRIVKRIVEAHGWSISVSESEAGGARFEISGVTVVGDDTANP